MMMHLIKTAKPVTGAVTDYKDTSEFNTVKKETQFMESYNLLQDSSETQSSTKLHMGTLEILLRLKIPNLYNAHPPLNSRAEIKSDK